MKLSGKQVFPKSQNAQPWHQEESVESEFIEWTLKPEQWAMCMATMTFFCGWIIALIMDKLLHHFMDYRNPGFYLKVKLERSALESVLLRLNLTLRGL